MYNVLVLGDNSYKKAFDADTFSIRAEPWWLDDNDIDYLLEQAEVICFTGGEDVHPDSYGAPMAYEGEYDIDRDVYETRWYRKAKELHIPCVGICRGAQFLNVMNHGAMIQDIEGHHGSHTAYSYTDPDYELVVSSDHHQMMVPAGNAEILLYATDGHGHNPSVLLGAMPDGPGADDEFSIPFKVDPEVVLYRMTKDLCHQPHPEWQEPTSLYWMYFNHTVRNLLKL